LASCPQISICITPRIKLTTNTKRKKYQNSLLLALPLKFKKFEKTLWTASTKFMAIPPFLSRLYFPCDIENLLFPYIYYDFFRLCFSIKTQYFLTISRKIIINIGFSLFRWMIFQKIHHTDTLNNKKGDDDMKIFKTCFSSVFFLAMFLLLVPALSVSAKKELNYEPLCMTCGSAAKQTVDKQPTCTKSGKYVYRCRTTDYKYNKKKKK